MTVTRRVITDIGNPTYWNAATPWLGIHGTAEQARMNHLMGGDWGWNSLMADGHVRRHGKAELKASADAVVLPLTSATTRPLDRLFWLGVR
jgi:hypothetical protein